MHGTTAAHSSFCNGLCEKNHKVVDKRMAKLMADDKTLKPDDALHHALFSKNVELNKSKVVTHLIAQHPAEKQLKSSLQYQPMSSGW